MRKLDLVIPCFNEQESLPLFFEALKDVKDKMNDVSVRFIFLLTTAAAIIHSVYCVIMRKNMIM